MISCNDKISLRKDPTEICEEDYQTIVIDSCEYITDRYGVFLTHKGNCKYCMKRHQKFGYN